MLNVCVSYDDVRIRGLWTETFRPDVCTIVPRRGILKNMSCLGIDFAALRESRRVVDDVFGLVAGDCFYERPVPERHRIVFYVGHVEAFDLNLLRTQMDIASFAPELDQLFAFGIDPPAGSLPLDAASDWPRLDVVAHYCQRVRALIDACWDATPELLRHVAIEHRLMHAETLCYMLHNFEPSRLVQPPVFESADTYGSLPADLCHIPAGPARLGRSRDEGFGWDNEFDGHEVHVPAFSIDRWKVTNGAYLEFVRTEGAATPFFWTERNGSYFLRRMFDQVPLPLDWPVYVTHAEASAYAAWRGGRLPTECEWLRASETAPVVGNFDLRRFDPEPGNANPDSASCHGVEDMVGNGWEWTSSLFRPFPGFRAFPFYEGYSAPFFDDDHYVLKGASPRTHAVFTRPSFRNWFRRDYPYVFASFRCIPYNS